jgi:hypothetical protein
MMHPSVEIRKNKKNYEFTKNSQKRTCRKRNSSNNANAKNQKKMRKCRSQSTTITIMKKHKIPQKTPKHKKANSEQFQINKNEKMHTNAKQRNPDFTKKQRFITCKVLRFLISIFFPFIDFCDFLVFTIS